jgi:hypothetical protein
MSGVSKAPHIRCTYRPMIMVPTGAIRATALGEFDAAMLIQLDGTIADTDPL